MTRIDFYLLQAGADNAARLVSTTCRLCEKAAEAGQRVYVNSPEEDLTATLDAALWSFRQGSFISHERYTESIDPVTTSFLPMVFFGTLPPPASHQAVLINLARETPPFFSQFERVLEVVAADAATRSAARQRYRFYKDRGYALNTHELGKAGEHSAH